MNKQKIILIIINIFFLIFKNNISLAESNFYIVVKVDNEIITNVDIAQEINYLISLNNDLQKMNKKRLIKLAKDSASKQISELKKINKVFNSSFIKAVDSIYNCKGKVICAGVGKSGLIARKISSTLSSVGISSFFFIKTSISFFISLSANN